MEENGKSLIERESFRSHLEAGQNKRNRSSSKEKKRHGKRKRCKREEEVEFEVKDSTTSLWHVLPLEMRELVLSYACLHLPTVGNLCLSNKETEQLVCEVLSSSLFSNFLKEKAASISYKFYTLDNLSLPFSFLERGLSTSEKTERMCSNKNLLLSTFYAAKVKKQWKSLNVRKTLKTARKGSRVSPYLLFRFLGFYSELIADSQWVDLPSMTTSRGEESFEGLNSTVFEQVVGQPGENFLSQKIKMDFFSESWENPNFYRDVENNPQLQQLFQDNKAYSFAQSWRDYGGYQALEDDFIWAASSPEKKTDSLDESLEEVGSFFVGELKKLKTMILALEPKIKEGEKVTFIEFLLQEKDREIFIKEKAGFKAYLALEIYRNCVSLFSVEQGLAKKLNSDIVQNSAKSMNKKSCFFKTIKLLNEENIGGQEHIEESGDQRWDLVGIQSTSFPAYCMPGLSGNPYFGCPDRHSLVGNKNILQHMAHLGNKKACYLVYKEEQEKKNRKETGKGYMSLHQTKLEETCAKNEPDTIAPQTHSVSLYKSDDQEERYLHTAIKGGYVPAFYEYARKNLRERNYEIFLETLQKAAKKSKVSILSVLKGVCRGAGKVFLFREENKAKEMVVKKGWVTSSEFLSHLKEFLSYAERFSREGNSLGKVYESMGEDIRRFIDREEKRAENQIKEI